MNMSDEERENFKQKWKTDSGEDVKINKVNENGRWLRFFFYRSFGIIFNSTKKIKILKNY